MTLLKWTAILVVIGYIGCVAFFYATQRTYLFPTPQTIRTSPEAAGFPQAEEHFLKTADGETIIIWYVPAKPGCSVVVFFPGNGDFLAGRINRFEEMTSDGAGLVAVSYRGYAGSTGRPSEKGLLLDAEAAYAFAAARYDAGKIVLWGFSLGSGVAVALAATNPVGKLILEAPYTSTADVAASLLPLIPVRWLMKGQFRSDERITYVATPLLVMHGIRDHAIPITLGEKLFSLAHEPKKFVRFAEGGHDNLAEYGAIQVARQFITSKD